MTTPLITRDRRAIIIWLSLCALLVAAMVCIGGYTRLSGSGLSITSWKPIHGVLPPLNIVQWSEEFGAYQQSPQFQKVNSGMTLAEFKEIFWPEFFHRLLGRLVGAVFFLPLIVFAVRRSITQRFGWRLAGIFALGGLQGLIGWLMVASGLVDDPHVSPLRLALHLSVAFTIFGTLLWAIFDVQKAAPSLTLPPVGEREHCIPSPASRGRVREGAALFYAFFTLLCLQIILGAFMAGLHAGLVYNTWPTMNGQWLPDGLTHDHLTLVQFFHRTVAVLVAFSFVFWWYYNRNYVKNNRLYKICAVVAITLTAQFILGILTLINAVPLNLALTHQMTALLLFGASIVLGYGIRHPRMHLLRSGISCNLNQIPASAIPREDDGIK